VAGVERGSMRRYWRRTRGVLVLRSVGRVEWRRVMGKSEVGMVRLESERRFGRIARGCDVVGVRMSLGDGQ
jgi:hypothetical protein